LTSLGILIGVLAVVLLTAFGLGLKKYIQNQFESLGTNLIYVLPGGAFNEGGFNADSTFESTFDTRDVKNLSRLKSAKLVVPAFQKNGTAKGGSESKYTSVILATADVFEVLNLKPIFGELFTKTEVDKKTKTAVIGPKLAEKLFETAQNAVGKTINLFDINFKIHGVLESKGGGALGGPSFDNYVYIPYTSAPSLNPNNKFLSIYVQAQNRDAISLTKEEVTTELLKRYKKDDFSVVESTEILNAISSIFNILNIILVAIAAISLLVGGIGIMNIMYVTVTERIKEIGIRRSVGATKVDILSQFLVESIILSLFGGLAGLTLAFLITLGIQSLFPAYIDTTSVILALGVSSGIGILFGVLPARKAAALSPIEAIRYE